MATYELIGLDESTPQLLAPTSSDTGTIINFAVTGTFTLGDASGDSFSVNSAAWTLNNAVTVTGTWADLGTVTTADINGGTIDGTVIGGSSAAAVTGTVGTFTTSAIINSDITITSGSIVSASGAISFGNENLSTTGTLTVSGGGSLTGTWSDLGTVTTIDINGGTVDGVTIGGSSAGAGTFTNLASTGNTTIGNATGDGFTINPGSWTLSNAVTVTGTWADLGTVTTVDMNGGTVDGAVIGGSTPAAGTFTTLDDQYGDVRDIPSEGADKTTSYELTTADIGQYVGVGSGGSITIPDATFSAGNAVSIFNNTTGNITITCTITTAYISGTNTDQATVTLATRGVCTILFISGTVCVIAGSVS